MTIFKTFLDNYLKNPHLFGAMIIIVLNKIRVCAKFKVIAEIFKQSFNIYLAKINSKTQKNGNDY